MGTEGYRDNPKIKQLLIEEEQDLMKGLLLLLEQGCAICLSVYLSLHIFDDLGLLSLPPILTTTNKEVFQQSLCDQDNHQGNSHLLLPVQIP